MPGPADPSRIYEDPALTERRGDATGPTALLFLGGLLGAFALAAIVLISLPPVGADPTPRPTAAPTTVASVGPSPTPQRTVAPSVSPPPSVAPTGPLASPRPGEVAIGQPAPLVVDERRVGTVTVVSLAPADLPGRTPTSGGEFLRLEVRFDATGRVAYRARHWVLVGEDGTRYEALRGSAPPGALGAGRLRRGETASGVVAFERPADVTIASVVLTDGAGEDLVVVDAAGG